MQKPYDGFIHTGNGMGRRQTLMERYKLQMKAYKKKRMKVDNTPYLPPDGVVYIMDSLNPEKPIRARIVEIKEKQHRKIIKSLACPVCGNAMEWDEKWEAFVCEKHGKRAIYEIVKQK
ncbi:MAG: hypothetical protein J7K13_03490 [Thermoplasmata archaeon]|nr:hypothetical protein [Thermoplasmata archaeon]HDD57649.1 hypothetical protein [Thermoplasmatales archaeon]